MLGTKLAVMKDGVIQQSGEPLALYRHPRNLFVAGFIGWPAMNLIPGSLAAQGPELYFAGRQPGGFTLKLDRAKSKNLERFVDKEVVFGIRPENIGNGTFQSGASFEGVVELIEPVGAETYVHLAHRAASFVARAPSQENLTLNQKRVLNFDLSAARFFDAATGEAIY